MKTAARWLLGILFVLAGLNHFLKSDFYVSIMPPYLPWPLALVYISGVFESLLGAIVLVTRWRRLAGWGLIALLIAVFPANLHMALHTELFPEFSPLWLWLRLPLQAVIIAWVYWCAISDSPPSRTP